MINKFKIKYPWIFWINISIRTRWFSWLWKTRGANFIEFQFLIFKITIGLPWLTDILNAHLINDDIFTNNKYSIQIGNY